MPEKPWILFFIYLFFYIVPSQLLLWNVSKTWKKKLTHIRKYSILINYQSTYCNFISLRKWKKLIPLLIVCLFVCLFCFVLFFSPFIKVFAGNYDQKAIVYHDLSPPIVGRYIRFRPVNWQEGIAMRVELFGCPGNLKWRSLKREVLIFH